MPTFGYVTFVLAALGSLAVAVTTWRVVLPRAAWEDPSVVGVNRLPTHSRLCNYPTFEAAEAREKSSNLVSLRCIFSARFESGHATEVMCQLGTCILRGSLLTFLGSQLPTTRKLPLVHSAGTLFGFLYAHVLVEMVSGGLWVSRPLCGNYAEASRRYRSPQSR